ncbi:MAG: hypothetical protein AB7H90_18385 [Alphaproteobacteria bacterium]
MTRAASYCLIFLSVITGDLSPRMRGLVVERVALHPAASIFLSVIAGDLSPRVRGLVVERAALYREELREA